MGRVEIGLYILGALIVLVVVAWAASVFLGCVIERQWVVPVAPAPVDFDERPPNFVVARNAAAFDLGFSGGAVHVHPRGGSYRVQALLWLSPDRRTLATIAGGTILSLEYRRVVLYSRLSDGRVLATVDQPYLENVSGLFVLAHGMDLDFREVWALHERRVAEAGPAVLPLTTDLLGELTGICLDKTRRLIDGGTPVTPTRSERRGASRTAAPSRTGATRWGKRGRGTIRSRGGSDSASPGPTQDLRCSRSRSRRPRRAVHAHRTNGRPTVPDVGRVPVARGRGGYGQPPVTAVVAGPVCDGDRWKKPSSLRDSREKSIVSRSGAVGGAP